MGYLTLHGLSNAPGIGPVVKEKVSKLPGFGPKQVNHCIKKNESKVVDTIDIEDMGDKGVFCRCWKSKKFPYCDGSHNKHNQETGDNTGPLIVKRKTRHHSLEKVGKTFSDFETFQYRSSTNKRKK